MCLRAFPSTGPEGRTRTDTSSLTADFESAASTNFTTSGVDERYITRFHSDVNAEYLHLFNFKTNLIFLRYKAAISSLKRKKVYTKPSFYYRKSSCNFLILALISLTS